MRKKRRVERLRHSDGPAPQPRQGPHALPSESVANPLRLEQWVSGFPKSAVVIGETCEFLGLPRPTGPEAGWGPESVL